MQSKLPKMILKVRHCCLLRLPRYCSKSLLTLKAFNLIAVLHPGASKNQCHQSSRLFSLCSDIKTRHTIAWSASISCFYAEHAIRCFYLTKQLPKVVLPPKVLLPLAKVPKVLLPFMTKQLLLCMIKQGIDALRKATQFLNSGQTPVMAFDAPLFALTKFIQYKWPETHGEDKFIETFMALHPFATSNFHTQHFGSWSVLCA